ncbi:MAG: hypothetical protein K6F46_07550 [Desulfovibrio sp.]|nr:hypothetical protein [Desulfovibrio sp.]
MTSKIILYDAEFLKKFEELKRLLEDGDRLKLKGFLLENFDFVFKTQQYYAKRIAEGDARDFEEADERIRRELMRPLSHRQYRMIEQAFISYEEDDVLSSLWTFLDDCGRIRHKTAMSSAEVGGCSLILEQVHCLLTRE